MERITIVLPSALTVPAIKGGAVEQLLDNFLRMNEINPQFECTVIAHYIDGVEQYRTAFKYTTFQYIKMPTLFIRINSILINVFQLKWLPDFWEDFLVKAVVKAKNEKVLLEGNAQLVEKLRKSFPEAKIFSHIHADLILANSQEELDRINNTEKIICISQYTREQQLKRKLNPEKVVSVLNGIETEKFMPENSKLDDKSIKKLFHIPENKKVILFKGRIVKEKGVVELLEAFSQIGRKDIVLIMAGSKNFGEKRYRKSHYEKQVEQYVKKDNRIIMLNYVEYEKIPLLHKISDIAVVPSIWQEPCGLVVIEAMAAGTPLIASRTGGIPEVVGEAKSILIEVDENFIMSMKNAIELLFSDSELCKEIRESQLKRTKDLSNERYFRDLCEVLHGNGKNIVE